MTVTPQIITCLYNDYLLPQYIYQLLNSSKKLYFLK